MMYGWPGTGVVGGILGVIGMLLFWALIILGIVWLVKAVSRSGSHPVEHESALDIARKRYARGEITKEQFEQIKRDLIS